MRIAFSAIVLIVAMCRPALAQISVGVGVQLPSVSIGFDIPSFPTLTLVPGYPVYYAPQVDANLFFYDGMYWTFANDRWYASSWFNGPWGPVAADAVPLFLWRIPASYYRRPPPYFRGWRADGPPPWDRHWGYGWAVRHPGWDHWDRRSMPAPAPLPRYQQGYSGSSYPRAEQQQGLRGQNYHYAARDPLSRHAFGAATGGRGGAAGAPPVSAPSRPGPAFEQPRQQAAGRGSGRPEQEHHEGGHPREH